MKNLIKNFIKEEDGVGVIEIVLILAALVALGLIFKDKITELFNKLWGNVEDKTKNLD